MKFSRAFLIFVIFCEIGSIKVPNSSAMKKAFVDIVYAVSKQSHLLSIVRGSNITYFDVSTAYASKPHNVVTFDEDSNDFRLNSSAIVSLDSIESLLIFNNHTVVPVTLAMSQQLIIYCQDATFDQIAMTEFSNTETPILQYEYFVVEGEKSIRLLTFL